MNGSPKAVVLLSGGLDSCVAAALVKRAGFELYCLSFDYAQRNKKELDAAKIVACKLGAKEWICVNAGFISMLSDKVSPLTNPDTDLPKDRTVEEIRSKTPITYVPARNSVFLSIAASYADAMEAKCVVYGAAKYSTYPDCQPNYVQLMSAALTAGTKSNVFISAPVIVMDKGEIVRRGLDLSAPLAYTWSCYEDQPEPCGKCDSCVLRAEGFATNQIVDPLLERLSEEKESEEEYKHANTD